jgi:outer membrane lipoprotein SlyB
MKISTHASTMTLVALSFTLSLTACDMPAPSVSTGGNSTGSASVAAPAICNDCGTITNIEQMKEKGSGSGAGAAIGAVAGAVIGHQIGDGSGKDAATATGAIGGGIAGHQIERRIQGTAYFHVTIAMENGSTHIADVETLNGLAVGSKVKVVGNNLQAAG